MALASAEITGLLKAWGAGDRTALDRLMPVIYAEIRQLAHHYMIRERQGNSMQTTALINEVYLRLIKVDDVHWNDRTHFFAISAQLMRRVPVDAARARSACKRGGQARKVEHSSAVNFDEVAVGSTHRERDLIAIDDALEALAQFDPRKAHIVELRFFGGLNVDEAAQVLGLSQQTVMRDWKLARVWLRRELSQ